MVVNSAILEGHTREAGIQQAQTEELKCELPNLQFPFDKVDIDLSRSTIVSLPHFFRENRNILWDEILMIVSVIAWFLVHNLVGYLIVDCIFWCWVLGIGIYVIRKHTRSLHWQFFNIWIKQMKVIILILASLTIFWTDLYYGITFQLWSILLPSVAVNLGILFFISVDLMDMTLFLRASIPAIQFIIAVSRIYRCRFIEDDIPLWTFHGRELGILHIQSVAYSQILVFAILALKSVVTDTKHEKFYFIEKNEKRGADYSIHSAILVWTDTAFLTIFLVYVCTIRFNVKIGWQVISGLSLVFVGIPFLRGVKLKFSYFVYWRPVLLILATVIILFCNTYRLVLPKTKQVERSINTIVYVYCVMVAILSDFHTGSTNMFRLFVTLLMIILTGVNVYYCLFVLPDVGLITIRDRTLGVNSVERYAYCQVLFLLQFQLVSLVRDPSHSKFFLIQNRCQRCQLFEKFSTKIEIVL